jgi:hypothetical protein
MSITSHPHLVACGVVAAAIFGALHALTAPLLFPDSAAIHIAVGLAQGPMTALILTRPWFTSTFAQVGRGQAVQS